MPKKTPMEKIQQVQELLKDSQLTMDKIAQKVGLSWATVFRIKNKRGKFAEPKTVGGGEVKITNIGPAVKLSEVLENGNVIRPSTKGLVPASQLRAKLCQAYFYLDRDKAKAKEAIAYCITLVDQAEQ